jgi:hypothetical protein
VAKWYKENIMANTEVKPEIRMFTGVNIPVQPAAEEVKVEVVVEAPVKAKKKAKE